MNWKELKTKLTRKQNAPPRPVRHLTPLVFIVFLLTFVISRVCVILIMTRRMPNLFFHAGGTHVHHLNYGILLLSVTTAVLLLAVPTREARALEARMENRGLRMARCRRYSPSSILASPAAPDLRCRTAPTACNERGATSSATLLWENRASPSLARNKRSMSGENGSARYNGPTVARAACSL